MITLLLIIIACVLLFGREETKSAIAAIIITIFALAIIAMFCKCLWGYLKTNGNRAAVKWLGTTSRYGGKINEHKL